MKKVYVVTYGDGQARFIPDAEIVRKIEDAEYVIFPGGEDINPAIYNCKRHESVSWLSNERDRIEIDAFNKMRPDQFAIGLCRGAQLICALYGGILVQDCTNHCGCRHSIINKNGEEYITNSIHHQMQFPYYLDEKDYEVLYRSTTPLSKHYEGDKVNAELIAEKGEPEIVVYHRENMPTCLAIQGHPEMWPESEFAGMVNELINTYLVNNR